MPDQETQDLIDKINSELAGLKESINTRLSLIDDLIERHDHDAIETQRLDTGTITHADLASVTADQHHTQSHTIVSHSDTTGTGAELNELTDASETTLHSHAKIVTELVASDNLEQSADTEQTSTSTPFEKKKEIKVRFSGTIRIKFDLKSNSGPPFPANGQIYVNGIAVGIDQLTRSSTFVTFSEDISGIHTDDLVQLFVHADPGKTMTTRNFRFHFDKATVDDTTVLIN